LGLTDPIGSVVKVTNNFHEICAIYGKNRDSKRLEKFSTKQKLNSQRQLSEVSTKTLTYRKTGVGKL
jgi:hypothetical protein